MYDTRKAWFITFGGVVILCAIVGGSMYFATHRLGVLGFYWLVPICGSFGGIAGGVLRTDGKLVLCASNASEASLRLGIVGDVIVGLAGATAVVFLFGGTLKYSSDDKNSLVILVSVSLIAGIYGRNVVEAAGDKLLNKAKKEAEKTARDIVGPSAATIYALAAGNALETNQPLEEAMKFAEKAIEIDPSNLSGYIEKGRVLKRLNRVEEALDLMEQTARIRKDPRVMYNLGCYRALLKKPLPSIRSALSEAFALHPKLRDLAKKDADLDSVRNMPEMKELGISAEPTNAEIIDKQNPGA